VFGASPASVRACALSVNEVLPRFVKCAPAGPLALGIEHNKSATSEIPVWSSGIKLVMVLLAFDDLGRIRRVQAKPLTRSLREPGPSASGQEMAATRRMGEVQ
jgi:hypothetical protein